MGVDAPILSGAAAALENRALPERRGAAGRGRPAGVLNRRSLDLARWIAATFGGMTPGQQAASVALVSPEDVDTAAEDARALGMVNLGLEPVTLALAVKARRLAAALHCDAIDAWAIMSRERDGLMRYVHQVQPPARDAAGAPPATVYLIPEGEVHEVPSLPGEESQDPDFPELFPDGQA
jgi:hypothetical protein